WAGLPWTSWSFRRGRITPSWASSSPRSPPMTPAQPEERNPYKGTPSRAWAHLRLVSAAGQTEELAFLVDTGNPYPLILGRATADRLAWGVIPDVLTNFGLLQGRWLRLAMAGFGLDCLVAGYGSDVIEGVARGTSPDLDGLAGLPLPRLFEYGGNADWFWLRPAAAAP